MNQLSEYILKKAIEADICQEWAGKIKEVQDVDGLLNMYKKGIDFCLSKNFPSNEDLVRLGGEALQRHGVYADGSATLTNPEFVVLLGCSRAGVSVEDFNVSQLYVKHKSDLQLVASANAFVVIDCFDDSSVIINAFDDSKVLVNIYGNARIITHKSGNAHVKIIRKNKLTY